MKIVAFGDSITEFQGWVDMLYGELGCQVVNAGVAGNRTSHALKRIEEDVIAQKPDLTIINFGINDQALNGSTKKNLTPIHVFESNYRKIIEKIQATGSDIILVAVHDVYSKQYGGGSPVYNGVDEKGVTYVDRYNEVVKRLAEEYKVGFLDINSLIENDLQFITVDGIHLNEVGQNRYFKFISDYCYEYVAPDYVDTNDVNNEEADGSNGILPVVIIIPFICLCVAVVLVVLLKKKKRV
jgi:lysophospholipase L1-like esterase